MTSTLSLPPLPRFENVLRPHQVQHARQLYRALSQGPSEWGFPGAVDLSDVGVGKSFMDLSAMANVRPKVVILCPLAGIPGWQATCQMFGIIPHFIGSHQAVRGGWRPEIGNIPTGGRFFRWKDHQNIGIILDEAQFANGINTQMMACMGGAIQQGIPIIAASASMGTSPLHLRIAGRITGLHKGGDDWWKWIKNCGCKPDDNEPDRWVWPTSRKRQSQILGDIHSTLIPMRGCRLRKADCGEQAGTTISTLALEVPEGEEIEAEWQKLDANIKFMTQSGYDHLQITNTRRAGRMKLWKKSEMALVRPVVDLIKTDVKDGNSVVCFFSFTESRMLAGKLLKTKAGLYGGQSPKQRAHLIKEFQGNREFILLNNFGAGGSSVSLHDLTGDRPRKAYIFMTDKFTAMAQAPGRIDRYGGKTHSLQYVVCIKGGMSQAMVESTTRKLINLGRLNDGREGGQRDKTTNEMI